MDLTIVDLRRGRRRRCHLFALGQAALDAELHRLAAVLDEVGPARAARLVPVAQQARVALHLQLEYPHHGEQRHTPLSAPPSADRRAAAHDRHGHPTEAVLI